MNEKLFLGNPPSTEDKYKANLRDSPYILEKLKEQGYPERRKPETLLAQGSAVVSDHVTLVAFEGLDDPKIYEVVDENREDLIEYYKRGLSINYVFSAPPEGLIEAEARDIVFGETPHIGTSNTMYERMSEDLYNVTEVMRGNNSERIMEFVKQSIESDEFREKFGPDVDMYNLTPYQANWLVGLVIAQNVKYENKINIPEVQRIKVAKGSVDEELTEALELEKQIDSYSADKILENGKGVCRHMAMTATSVYIELKKIQRGRKLVSTHLLYYSPYGSNSQGMSDANHAYNVFVMANGEQEDPDLVISVLDPTWAIEENLDLDQTYRRTSSAVSFIARNGKAFGINNPKEEASQLASALLARVQQMPTDSARFNDVISLLRFTDKDEEGIVSFVMEHTDEQLVPSILERFFQAQSTSSRFYFDDEESINCRLQSSFFGPLFNRIAVIDLEGKSVEDVHLRSTMIENFTTFAATTEPQKPKTIDSSYYVFIKQMIRCFKAVGHVPHSDRGLVILDSFTAQVQAGEFVEEDPEILNLINWYVNEKSLLSE